MIISNKYDKEKTDLKNILSKIKNFSEESVLPALTFQGRNYIIPYWMQGYYEIEEAITKGYKKDLEKIYPNRAERLKVKKVVKTLIKNKNRMLNAKMKSTLETTKTTNDQDIFGNGFDAISVLFGKLDKPKNKKKIIPSNEIENIDHFFVLCPLYVTQRIQLFSAVRYISNVSLDVMVIVCAHMVKIL